MGLPHPALHRRDVLVLFEQHAGKGNVLCDARGIDAAELERAEPVHQLARGGLFLDAVDRAQPIEGLHRLCEQRFVELVKVDADDLRHLLLRGEGDVVEDAAAQEGVGQLLFRVGRDDDDGALLCLDRFLCFGNVELHLVQLPEEVVGELKIGLVHLVDEQHHLLVGGERLAELAELDVFCDVVHAGGAELAVVETLDDVVDVQTVLRLGGGFHVPDDELLAQRVGDGLRQHGLARAGLALDEQRLFERHGDVHCVHQFQRDGYESTIENMRNYINDIAGIRIVCSFTSDIYRLAEMIGKQNDLTVICVKDYIKNPKVSGYKSFHMHVTVPIFLSDRVVETKVEIQIRTIAMDFWASLEHKIYYKFEGHAPEYISRDLRACAEIVSNLDAKMLQLNEAILEEKEKEEQKKKEE